jgi:hypothetical protein
VTDKTAYCPPNVDCSCYRAMVDEIDRLNKTLKRQRDLNLDLAANYTRSHNEAERLRRRLTDIKNAIFG